MHREPFEAMLAGGDRRSLGRAEEVLAVLSAAPARLPELVACLEAASEMCPLTRNPVICMRAADVLEKFSRGRPASLAPYKALLLAMLHQAMQKELRWHLALMVPRLDLSTAESSRVAVQLESYLDDRSSIVKTFAMQGLADLAHRHPTLRPGTLDLLRTLTRTGTPAMRARGRMLVVGLGRE